MLFKNPVSPNKKFITFVGVIISLIFGSSLSFYKEKRSDLIFNTSQIRNSNQYKSIEEININNSNDLENSLNILSKSSLTLNKEFVILIVGKINKQFIALINTKISKISLPNKVHLTKDIKEINPSQNIILLTALKRTTFKELYKVNEYFKLIGKKYIHTYVVKDIEITSNESDLIEKFIINLKSNGKICILFLFKKFRFLNYRNLFKKLKYYSKLLKK